MPHELMAYKQFPLHLARWSADVTAIRSETGPRFLAFRHLCRAVGVDYDTQREVLAQHPDWYPPETQPRLRADTPGGPQEMLFLRQKEAAWWLAHLNPARVRKEIRGRLEDFIADVMAAADRLAFGDLSEVVKDTSLVPVHPSGAWFLSCPRCGVSIKLGTQNGAIIVEVEHDQRGL